MRSVPAHALFIALAFAGGLSLALGQTTTAPGFSPLPLFAAEPVFTTSASRWEGQYVQAWSGFAVTKFGHGPTVAGPELGLNIGRSWRQGNVVYGLAAWGAFSPTTIATGGAAPGLGWASRDFSGGAYARLGVLPSEDVLLYTSVGVTAARTTYRLNPATLLGRDEAIVRPDLRAGVEWAVTPSFSMSLEVGSRPAFPRFP